MKEFMSTMQPIERGAWSENLLPEAKAEEIARLELDFDKIKQCYPSQVTRIRYMVEDTCDRLEYEGSPMFDELPDAATMQRLAHEIYQQVADDDTEMIPCISWPVEPDDPVCHGGACRVQDVVEETVPAAVICRGQGCMPSDPPTRGCRGGGCVPPYVPDCDSGNCMLRQMIEVMLLNEMFYRRNRYRTRRW